MSFAPMRRQAAYLTALLLLGALFVSGHAAHAAPLETLDGAEYQFYDPAPTGEIRVNTPSVSWEVIPPVGMRVTEVNLTLDSLRVDATYNVKKRMVEYTPSAPLAAGRHTVACELILDSKRKIPQRPMTWEFRISAGAIAALPTPDDHQREVFSALNELRRVLKKPGLVLDNRLCAAAASHSTYQVVNKRVTHNQKPGAPGFSGVDVNERTGKLGFDKPCFECIGQGFNTTEEALRRIFDAPYHRAAFLQPGVYQVGIGINKDVLTLDFSLSEANGLVFYPAARQQDVPTMWEGVETNGPLRLHGVPENHGSVGYPITLFLFGADNPRLSDVKATITASDGSTVPFYLNSPDNDQNLQGETVSGVMLTPKKPLRANTVYKVSIAALETNGSEVTRTWSFTTGNGK